MSLKDTQLFVATFLAIFVVLSPTVQFLFLTGQGLPDATGISQKDCQVKEKDMVGQPASKMKISYSDGEWLDFADFDFQGNTVVLYLWSDWSPLVPKGLWYLNQLYLNQEKPDVIVLAGKIGFTDSLDKIEYYFKRRNLQLPVVLCNSEVLLKFNVKEVPAVLIVDTEGIIRYQALGEIEKEEFENVLDSIAAGKAVEPLPSAGE